MEERRPQGEEVPADPTGIPEPHDVLAADEFGIGTRDNRYPADPTGIEDAHDVLAAEEFAMPARDDRVPSHPGGGFDPRVLVPPLLALVLVTLVLRRRGR